MEGTDGIMEGAGMNWRKSSYSGNGGGNCTEVATTANLVLVRDTKNRAGVVLRFSPGAWRRFARQVKRSLADLLRACNEHSRVLGCPFGVSGVVPRGRRGAACVLCHRASHFLSVISCGRVLVAPLRFPRLWVRRAVSCWGGRNGGLGENLKPGGSGCSGGSGFSPRAFPDWSPLLLVVSRDGVFPTSPSRACWGVRPGTWRWRGGRQPPQIPGPPSRPPAGAVLYGGDGPLPPG